MHCPSVCVVCLSWIPLTRVFYVRRLCPRLREQVPRCQQRRPMKLRCDFLNTFEISRYLTSFSSKPQESKANEVIAPALQFLPSALPQSTAHFTFAEGSTCLSLSDSKFVYVSSVDYKPTNSNPIHLQQGQQVAFVQRSKAHEELHARIGRIAVKQRQSHGVEVELIVVYDGKAREIKPNEVRVRSEDKDAKQLTEQEAKTVTDKADNWIRVHHLEAAARKAKQAEIAALDALTAGRLRPTIVNQATETPTDKDKDKDTEREKEREREREQRERDREREKKKKKKKKKSKKKKTPKPKDRHGKDKDRKRKDSKGKQCDSDSSSSSSDSDSRKHKHSHREHSHKHKHKHHHKHKHKHKHDEESSSGSECSSDSDSCGSRSPSPPRSHHHHHHQHARSRSRSPQVHTHTHSSHTHQPTPMPSRVDQPAPPISVPPIVVVSAPVPASSSVNAPTTASAQSLDSSQLATLQSLASHPAFTLLQRMR
jgi:hypothetical protein